jgi:short-subunit dehydrogenase
MNVLITGGSRGIGYKIAERFRQLGHIVICPTREECNLSNLNSVTEYLGNLKINVDILINNAGINKISKFDKISIDDINETNNVNFIAPLILSQHVIKICFLKNGFG